MKPRFIPNLDGKGRLVSGLGALGLFAGAWLAWEMAIWLGVLLSVSGVFVLFEALRGWCALRACGIKTRL